MVPVPQGFYDPPVEICLVFFSASPQAHEKTPLVALLSLVDLGPEGGLTCHQQSASVNLSASMLTLSASVCTHSTIVGHSVWALLVVTFPVCTVGSLNKKMEFYLVFYAV